MGFLRECMWRLELVILDLHKSHDVIPLDGDLVWCAVFDDDLAVVVFVNFEGTPVRVGDHGQWMVAT